MTFNVISCQKVAETLIFCKSLNSLCQNCGRPAFSNTALFLLATCVLPASPNFGQAKHGQTPPKVIFFSRNKGQLWAGKTRSKRPRSHSLSTVHLLPYMWASFYPLDPSRYLFSFSSWRPKTKKIPFFKNVHFALVKKTVGLLQTQF